MQEEAEHRMVLVVEGGAKMTPRLFAKALKQALKLGKGTVKLGWKGAKLPVKLYKHNLNKERHGKMTVKQLSRQNRGGVMSEIEIEAAGIKKFVPIAKKYGIDFAIRKVKPLSISENADSKAKQAAESEPEAGKNTYLIFFKGADKETVERAFAEYIDKYDPKKSQEQNEQDEQEPEKKPEQGQPARDGKTQPQKQSKERAQPPKQTQKQAQTTTQARKPAQKRSKTKAPAKKQTKGRAREKRPSLLKRLEQKKREVEDQRREIQRAPQELSR